MKAREAKIPVWKYVLAGAGAVFCVVAAVALTARAAGVGKDSGPSELTLHPENGERIAAERRAGFIKDQLGLSNEQTAQIVDILVEFRSEARNVRRNNAGDFASFANTMRGRLQEVGDRIRPILTPEQQQRFDEMREQRFQRTGALRQIFGL